MPFLRKRKRNCKPSTKRISSLRVHRTVMRGTFSQNTMKKEQPDGGSLNRKGFPSLIRFKKRSAKRVSHNTSQNSKKRRGSMTLEAAMVLPLFLFAVLNLFRAVNDITLHVKMQTAMHQTGLALARHAYAYERIGQGFELPDSALADVVFSQAYVRDRVVDAVGEAEFIRAGIHNGADGVSFLHSEILEGDRITMVADYPAEALFLPERFSSFRMVNRVCLRKWTGYDSAAGMENADVPERIVYVTEYGEVYHCSRNCYHINVRIRQTDAEALDGERNGNGGRYLPCELCGGRRTDGVFYITEEGERYHTTASCSGLRRTVRAIPISEVGSRIPCSHCGGL